MFAYNDMDNNKFIIKRDDSTTDFFRKWDELLTSAKADRLLDYLTGKTHVKPEGDVEALNKSRLSFFQTALIKQTKSEESTLTQQIWQEITDNELYAYLYSAPIIAVNHNFPTQEEVDNSRTRILYNASTYSAYLYKENETELPYNDPGRDTLGKLVTEKPVDFVGFDNVVEFNKNRQNDDNVVKAYKGLFS